VAQGRQMTNFARGRTWGLGEVTGCANRWTFSCIIQYCVKIEHVEAAGNAREGVGISVLSVPPFWEEVLRVR
jgi:hypothetical protein